MKHFKSKLFSKSVLPEKVSAYRSYIELLTLCYCVLQVGILAKIKTRKFCLCETGVGEGGAKSRLSSISRKCVIYLLEKSAYYEGFEDNFRLG